MDLLKISIKKPFTVYCTGDDIFPLPGHTVMHQSGLNVLDSTCTSPFLPFLHWEISLQMSQASLHLGGHLPNHLKYFTDAVGINPVQLARIFLTLFLLPHFNSALLLAAPVQNLYHPPVNTVCVGMSQSSLPTVTWLCFGHQNRVVLQIYILVTNSHQTISLAKSCRDQSINSFPSLPCTADKHTVVAVLGVSYPPSPTPRNEGWTVFKQISSSKDISHSEKSHALLAFHLEKVKMRNFLVTDVTTNAINQSYTALNQETQLKILSYLLHLTSTLTLFG